MPTPMVALTRFFITLGVLICMAKTANAADVEEDVELSQALLQHVERLDMQVNTAAAKFARFWTDTLLERVRKFEGTELRANQKVMAFDLFYAYAQFHEYRQITNLVRQQPNIIWIQLEPSRRGVPRPGATWLLQWIEHLPEFSRSAHLPSHLTRLRSQEDLLTLSEHVQRVIRTKSFVVFDDLSGQPDRIAELIHQLKEIKIPLTFVFVDRRDLLRSMQPSVIRRLSVLDEREPMPCEKALDGGPPLRARR